MRESLFNIVTARLDLTGLAVLDLYAGSGALGLEALSRGATSALFVESDQRTAAVIARNIETLGLPGATLRRGAVAVRVGGRAASPVDLVLADPPYDVETAEIQAVVAALATHGWVREGDRRGGRARGRERAADLAGRLAPMARAGLRRHPFGAGRIWLTRFASVVAHERRGMPGIF